MADISKIEKTVNPATSQPTGVTITRNGNSFAVKWKIGAKDYNSGQQMEWRPFGTSKWTAITVGKATTAKTVTFPASDYYPNAKKPAAGGLMVRIRGKRAPFDKTTKTEVTHYIPDWSEWTIKSYDFLSPNQPSLSAAFSEEYSNQTTFSWSTEGSSTSERYFVNTERQTVLVKNCMGALADGHKYFSGTGSGTSGSASGSQTISEDSATLAQASHTRWMRIRSRGPNGASAWKYARHVYARPYQAQNVTASAKQTAAGGFQCTVKWKAKVDEAHPVDRTEVQYVIATPTTGMACPSGASWSDADTVGDNTGAAGVSFSVDDILDENECLYIRVNTVHDRNTTYGLPVLAKTGYLEDPVGLSVSPAGTNFTITSSYSPAVPGAFLAVYYRPASAPSKTFVCGIIPNGSGSVTVSVPAAASESAYAFGVRAIVGTYTAKPRADGGTGYEIKSQMTSQNIVWDGGAVPSAPGNVTAVPAQEPGSIRVGWSWSWSGATEAELSWSDHADAWESTDQPSTFIVTNLYAAQWNIAGLETGKTWFVRVRMLQTVGDDVTYGPYSETMSVRLSSAPAQPVLQLSPGVITEEGSVTATWGYVSTDGTPQATAEIRGYSIEYVETTDVTIDPDKTYYTLNPGEPVDPDDPDSPLTGPFFEVVETPSAGQLSNYYEKEETETLRIAHLETQQQVTISAEDAGWTAGGEYGLRVKVWSGSGEESEWSDPVYVQVAVPLTVSIASTSLASITITDDTSPATTHTVTALTALPLDATITGAGEGGTTTLVIERADAYFVDRPDETTFRGHKGETIAIWTQLGEDPISITAAELIGSLDDGAAYNLVATVQDGLGQSATESLYFEVHWATPALIPEATVTVDQVNRIAVISYEEPVGAQVGDSFDVYRLSADKPEMILQGAEFDTVYVDPYPAIGPFGGHRVVYRTADGNDITTDKELAWQDLGEEEDDVLESIDALIDFNGAQLPIRFNSAVSSSWEKDFRETRYLGGSIQGDWNPAVGRSASLSGVARVRMDDDQIRLLRQLAAWPGICHVRTLDGSSYAADVQVSDSWDFGDGEKVVEANLTITRVDPEGLDGVTYAMWAEGMESE